METRKRNIVFDFENTAEAESTGWTHTAALSDLAWLASALSAALFAAFNSFAAAASFFFFSAPASFCGKGTLRMRIGRQSTKLQTYNYGGRFA